VYPIQSTIPCIISIDLRSLLKWSIIKINPDLLLQMHKYGKVALEKISNNLLMVMRIKMVINIAAFLVQNINVEK
jgi:hypothetical protein